jgi:hypothetical protein
MWRGAIVDDLAYWRERVPVWFTTLSIKLDSFENYSQFETGLCHGASYSFTLGDMRIRNSPVSGLQHLARLRMKMRDRLGKIYIFTALDVEEVESAYADCGVDERFIYLSKSDNIVKIMDVIKHSIMNNCQGLPPSVCSSR